MSAISYEVWLNDFYENLLQLKTIFSKVICGKGWNWYCVKYYLPGVFFSFFFKGRINPAAAVNDFLVIEVFFFSNVKKICKV